jgi:hypothetical protein
MLLYLQGEDSTDKLQSHDLCYTATGIYEIKKIKLLERGGNMKSLHL